MNLSDHTLLPSSLSLRVADVCCGVLYILTSLVCILGNTAALSYFGRKSDDLPSLLYLLTALVDVLIGLMNIVPGLCLFYERRSLIFANSCFCTFWDMLHFISNKFSVILVLILCVSRAHAVYRPLSHVHTFTKPRVGCFLIVFILTVLGIDLSQRLLGWGVSTYVAHDVYCWMTAPPGNSSSDMEVAGSDNLIYFYMIGGLLLALPVIPVAVASSLTVLNMRRVVAGSSHRGVDLKKQATITTILFALAYIVFNVPLFVNYVTWTATISFRLDLYELWYEKNTALYMYVWNVTDVLCPSLNATVNPIIYWTRISSFRRWTFALCRRAGVFLGLLHSEPENSKQCCYSSSSTAFVVTTKRASTL